MCSGSPVLFDEYGEWLAKQALEAVIETVNFADDTEEEKLRLSGWWWKRGNRYTQAENTKKSKIAAKHCGKPKN